MQPYFPSTANAITMLVVFLAMLVLCHLVLVWMWPLGKVAWKRVDYVWIGLTVTGLFVASAKVRTTFAEAQLDDWRDRAQMMYGDFRRQLTLVFNNPGMLCRTFLRSDLSRTPEEFERIQREYDSACEWVKRVAAATPMQMPADVRTVDSASWPPRPATTARDVNEIVDGLIQLLGYYNERALQVQALATQKRETETERSLLVVAPFLLAFGLALRLAKATGEIRLEKQSAKPES